MIDTIKYLRIVNQILKYNLQKTPLAPGILRDKAIDVNQMYIPNDYKQSASSADVIIG